MAESRLAGPAYLAAAAADVVVTPAVGLTKTITHVHIANETGSIVAASLWIGASGGSAGGTTIFKGKNVPANDAIDYYCRTVLKNGDSLSGLAGSGSSLVITVDGEQDVLP